MIDNAELNEIMSILEELEDEQLAVELLKEFNEKTATFGRIMLNMEEGLGHDEWKKECDKAKADVDEIVNKIKSLQ